MQKKKKKKKLLAEMFGSFQHLLTQNLTEEGSPLSLDSSRSYQRLLEIRNVVGCKE